MSDPAQPLDGEFPSFSRSERPSTTIVWSREEGFETLLDPPLLDNSRYQLCEEIERGGMGTIFLARDLQLARDVAIKVLRIDPASNPNAAAAYANEARIMSFLSHPGIAPIYDCGTCEDGRPFYVMKLVNGTTLFDMLRDDEVTPSQLLSVFADICETMAFAHSCGVLHLDLKPANVMVAAFGQVYVMDWGLARFEGSPPDDLGGWVHASRETKGPQPIIGTPEYMSPERARGERVDARTDVFGLGAILCEILVRDLPSVEQSIGQAYRQALRATRGDALDHLENCDTDRALVRLAKRCLARRRRDRPRNAVEVAQAMAAYQETALQRVESDMNRFFELSLDLFCIADFDGYFRRINSNFSRVLGYPDHELLARPFLEFVHEADREQTVQQMSVLKDAQPVVRFSNRYRTVNGRYVTLEWTAKAIDHENVIFAVARDVTSP